VIHQKKPGQYKKKKKKKTSLSKRLVKDFHLKMNLVPCGVINMKKQREGKRVVREGGRILPTVGFNSVEKNTKAVGFVQKGIIGGRSVKVGDWGLMKLTGGK